MSASAHHRAAATHAYALILDGQVEAVVIDRADPMTANAVADIIERGGHAERRPRAEVQDTEGQPWGNAAAALALAEDTTRRAGC